MRTACDVNIVDHELDHSEEISVLKNEVSFLENKLLE